MLKRPLEKVHPLLLLLVLVTYFFLCRAAMLSLEWTYHGDERWYTDAAIHMTQTADYLTPRFADGTPRFQKPIFTYWLIALSYKLMGIHLFSSRLPFLLAGCLLLVVTFLMTRSIQGDPQLAIAVTSIVASNFAIMDTSIHSSPDAFQLLFLTICLWGIAEILFKKNRSHLSYALLYLGGGMAVATKGLLATVAWAYGLVWLRALPGRKLRDMIHPQWLLVSAIFSLGWFGAVWSQHHGAVLPVFWGDQVGNKLSWSLTDLVLKPAAYVIEPVKSFFPWSVSVATAMIAGKTVLPSKLGGEEEARAGFLSFGCGWFLLLVAIFTFSKDWTVRYLLPSYPFIAYAVATCLLDLQGSQRLSVIASRVMRGLLFSGAAGGVVIAMIGFGWDQRLLFGGVLIFLGAATLLAVLRHQGVFGLALGVSFFVIGTYSLYEIYIHPVFKWAPTREISQQLLATLEDRATVATIDLQNKHLGQLNVITQGRFKFRTFDDVPADDVASLFPVIIASDRFVHRFNPNVFLVRECGRESSRVEIKEAWKALQSGDLANGVTRPVRQYYCIQPLSHQERSHGS